VTKELENERGVSSQLKQARAEMIDVVLRGTTRNIGPFLLIVASLDAISRDLPWMIGSYAALYLLVFIGYLLRARLSTQNKVRLIFWAIYFGGALSLICYGLVSPGSILLLCLSTLNSMLLGKRAGQRALLLSIAAHLFAFALRDGTGFSLVVVPAYLSTPLSWGTAILGFIGLWMALTSAAHFLLDRQQEVESHSLRLKRRAGDQAKVSEALADSEARYRRLTDHLPDLVWRTDLLGRILYVNPAVESLFGIPQAQAIGLGPHQYLETSSAEEVLRWKNSPPSSPGSGDNFRGELKFRHPQGASIICEVNASVVRDALGAPLAIEGVTRDISRQRALEEELAQSQRLESIGRLAGGIAHDFNNILAVILGRSALLLEDLDSGSPHLPDLKAIRASAERAKGVTEQLLTFSRRQMQKLEILELDDHLREINGMLSPLLGERVELHLELHSRGFRVELDRGQVTQLALNLAVNARDAMPEGGRLTLRTSRYCSPEGSESAQLEAIDTGTGMDAETQARIFEPFFTTKDKSKGTGLGLSTVYGIVQQSGGEIHVNSKLGEGSTFILRFPRTTKTPVRVAVRAAPAVTEGCERVLVVEDDSAVRLTTCRSLRSRGYEVIAAASGEEAIRLAKESDAPVDLLLTDVVMPGISGAALAEILQRMQPSMEVLFVSGYSQEELGRQGVLDDGVRLLPKPFAPEELLREVRSLLDV